MYANLFENCWVSYNKGSVPIIMMLVRVYVNMYCEPPNIDVECHISHTPLATCFLISLTNISQFHLYNSY